MIKIKICNGTACTAAGTQKTVKKWLLEYFTENEIGETACLGLCHDNFAVLYKGKAYSVVSPKTAERLFKFFGAS